VINIYLAHIQILPHLINIESGYNEAMEWWKQFPKYNHKFNMNNVTKIDKNNSDYDKIHVLTCVCKSQSWEIVITNKAEVLYEDLLRIVCRECGRAYDANGEEIQAKVTRLKK